jgi:mxaA protein
MKPIVIKTLFLLLFCLCAINANALETPELQDVKPGFVTIQTQNPDHKVGYTVGDILTRKVIVTIKKPYVLVDESLPIVGYERRYKGQLVGIDLSAITHTKKESNDSVTHEISLSYQVFTNNLVPKHGALPQEYLRLFNVDAKGKDIVKARIPSWDFAISPLSIFGSIKIEEDMSGFRGPLLLNPTPEKNRLKILLGVLGASLLGLLYMLGKHAWLPRMGGPFAKSYRAIRKQENTPQGIQNAVSSMHTALNETAGNSLFTGNLEQFFAKKPAFKAIQKEFEQFFGLSRQVFFEPNAQHQAGHDPIAWLAQFSRRCRDCERGLVPDVLSLNNK